jgi:AcrR family transcriptional regulator
MLPVEFVAEYKRERIAVAIAELAMESGLANVTTGMIIGRVRMARKTFYDVFPSRTAALEFACVEATRHLSEPLRAAGAEGGGERERCERAVTALIGAVVEQPAYAALAMVHSVSLDAGPADRYLDTVVSALAGAIDREQLGELAARSIVSVVSMQVMRGGSEHLPELREGLVGLAGV